MKLIYSFLFFLLLASVSLAQTKVGGYVYDQNNEPVAFANVLFKGSTEGTTTNENGRFYLESENRWDVLVISFIGYETKEIPLTKKVNYDLNIVLPEQAASLDEVVIVSGKQSKKESENPAIAILKKIWSRKRQNGLKQFKQYQYDKYEKVEFDLNTIDSSIIKSKIFKGMEFIFEEIDTSRITGKTYLPIFLNESINRVSGDNEINKEREELVGNKNSGFSNNQAIIDFIDDLYSDYDVYNNYLEFFDKSFVSPIGRTGINTYNYVLVDSAFIDNKWCYNIVYYPRRKSELTFKGDFWVNDSTFAIKEINLQATKSANINWVKEIYIEQEFEVLNDSVFLLKRDYFLSDFALNKREKSRGVYGKRTTLYDNYVFDQPKDPEFYDEKVFDYDESVYNRDDEFWDLNRQEALNKDERGVYKMLDTLTTVRAFRRLYNIGSVLSSGYYEFPELNLDYGPIFNTWGYNDIEGLRLRVGGRTYFSQNDLWRLEGFVAYGFKDQKFKYGISAKWLLNKKNRLIIFGGQRRDIEQLGANLTSSNDVLGRSIASNAVFTANTNDKLSNINLGTLGFEMEPVKNFGFRFNSSYRTISSASPTFSLDYNDPFSPTGVSSETRQFETRLSFAFLPKREMTGYGVERKEKNFDYARLFFQISQGFKGVFDSNFDYTKLQFSYFQPWQVGGFGRLTSSVEIGKTFGPVSLALLSVVPGNQTYFSIYNSFPQLDFYEFVTDTYGSFHIEHNFNGRLFSRIPFIKKWNLRTVVGFRGVWGQLSDENIALNTTDNPAQIILQAPDQDIYYEYSVGIDNIFKIFRIDFNFRGNYLDNQNARKFGMTLGFGFSF